MLARRGFATCALCALTGFVATSAEAQSSPIKRTILQRTDGPTAGYETVVALIEIEAGGGVARPTHPGMESTYASEGESTLMVDGQPPRKIAPGDAFQVPAGVP